MAWVLSEYKRLDVMSIKRMLKHSAARGNIISRLSSLVKIGALTICLLGRNHQGGKFQRAMHKSMENL